MAILPISFALVSNPQTQFSFDERKEFVKKLPKFIYDEEKALEKTRKILTEKISKLNSAIDDVSSQLRGTSDKSGEVEASF